MNHFFICTVFLVFYLIAIYLKDEEPTIMLQTMVIEPYSYFKARLVTYNLQPNIRSCNLDALLKSKRFFVKLGRSILFSRANAIKNLLLIIVSKLKKSTSL